MSLEGSVAADVSEAEAALARFYLEVGALADSEALARLLLRTEWVASSRIEGLEIGARRLLHVEAERLLGEPTRDVGAAEVLGNIDAMRFAVDSVAEGGEISVVPSHTRSSRRSTRSPTAPDALVARSSTWCSGAGRCREGLPPVLLILATWA